jgi:hypothetical protein
MINRSPLKGLGLAVLLAPLALLLVLVARGDDVDTASAGSHLPDGTLLTIDSAVGVPGVSIAPPGPGSWFSMDVFPSSPPLWTPFGPGTDGGIIIGGRDAKRVNEIIDLLRTKEYLIESVEPRRFSLEDIFMEVTGDGSQRPTDVPTAKPVQR